MITNTNCCKFRNYTHEASTVQVSKKALRLTVWIKILARSNNQAFGPFDGVFPLLSLKMARCFSWRCIEDEHLLLVSQMLTGVLDPKLHQLLYFYVASTNFSSSLNKWKKCGGHYLCIISRIIEFSCTGILLTF